MAERWVRALLLALALPSCVGGARDEVLPSDPQSELITDEDRACERDEDCTVVNAACCNCDQNGTKTAINKDARDDVDARRDDVCPTQACRDGKSTDPTCCAKLAVCRDHQCEAYGDPELRWLDGCIADDE